MTKQTDLVAYLFEGQPHLFSQSIMEWMETSSRFTAFVETCRDKIRKKIRGTRNQESILDLRGELEVVYCLLKNRHLTVAYEPYASAKKRSPDFAVTYRVNLVFNIEVARIRGSDGEHQTDDSRNEERLLRLLLYKLGQMQPGMATLLVIHTQEELAKSIDLDRYMQAIKTRAEARDPSFYTASPYIRPADFYKDFLHLTGILLWNAEAQLWINKQARVSLAEKVLRLIRSLPHDVSPA